MKANLKDFINYTDTLHIDFQIIGVTETWLNDITCKLYDMENYEILEQHRPSKTGGGVAIFLKNCIKFVRRNDIEIFNEYCESIFLEIKNRSLGQKKIYLLVWFTDHQIVTWLPLLTSWKIL